VFEHICRKCKQSYSHVKAVAGIVTPTTKGGRRCRVAIQFMLHGGIAFTDWFASLFGSPVLKHKQNGDRLSAGINNPIEIISGNI
jgi:hypothetical protein